MNRTPNPRDQQGRTLNQWPLLVVLAVLGVAMVVLAGGHWRRGSFTVGAAVLLAAVLRGALPTSTAGLLAVRSKALDVAITLGAAVALLALTMVVPHSRPGV